ncbi:MAG: phosphoribosylanthranilate isomerase [Xanthobacteraceae bacterium]
MPVEIKICGLNSQDGLDAALAAGADWVGLVFFPASPRHVDLAPAAALAARARGKAGVVALTVDMDDDALAALCAAVQPDMLQVHGAETPERVAGIRAAFGRPVMKALGIAGPADIARARHYAAVADRLLLDAKPPAGASRPGGNGAAFDWSLIAGLDLPKPFMLSGGLTPDTVAQALARTGAPGVDVSSGVESAPGLKDPDRIAAFVRAARLAGVVARPPASAGAPAHETSIVP